MDRKYRTSHQGIAAYLVTQGYEILRTENGQNKEGKPRVTIEFDLDQATGKEMGDAFFNGQVHGDLKAFHDAGYTVRDEIFKARGRR